MEGLRQALFAEEQVSREHLEQHGAKRIDIRTGPDVLAVELLGGLVIDRTRVRSCLCQLRHAFHLGNAEVEQLHGRLALLGLHDPNVFGFEVAVNDAFQVNRR